MSELPLYDAPCIADGEPCQFTFDGYDRYCQKCYRNYGEPAYCDRRPEAVEWWKLESAAYRGACEASRERQRRDG